MGQGHKTGCVLCAQNCGLEARVEDGRMVKIRPDKANHRCRGFPSTIMTEEIMNDHPQRLRAILVSACNPLRAYPDTQAYEKA